MSKGLDTERSTSKSSVETETGQIVRKELFWPIMAIGLRRNSATLLIDEEFEIVKNAASLGEAAENLFPSTLVLECVSWRLNALN